VATQTGSVDVWVAWTDPNTVAKGTKTERPDGECPDPLGAKDDSSIRCIYLQVGI